MPSVADTCKQFRAKAVTTVKEMVKFKEVVNLRQMFLEHYLRA